MSTIKALIIDDEFKARLLIRSLLTEYCPSVSIVGEAANIDEGCDLINAFQPDLVFLDIEMPSGTGFDLLDKQPDMHFKVIFTTAHETYALKALKASAIDFLLKPIDIDELIAAVEKVKKHFPTTVGNTPVAPEAPVSASKPQKLIIHADGAIVIVDTADIVHLKAEHVYSVLYLKGGKSYMTSKGLVHYESLLTGLPFFRIHKSHLINTAAVKGYNTKEGAVVEMVDGSVLPISRSRKDEFWAFIENKSNLMK